MRNSIILIVTICFAAWFSQRYDHLNGWIYFANIFLGGFGGWSISSVLLKASGNSKSSKHSTQMIGTISNIGYSTIRINNMPRYKVTVRYSGIEKSFEPIDPDIQFSLSIGDKAVVFINPEKPEDGYFDVKKSIAYKREHSVN